MDDATCDVLGLAWDGLNNDNLQIQCSVMTCLAVIVTVFIASEATGNYSQVDKLWSVIPAIVSLSTTFLWATTITEPISLISLFAVRLDCSV